MRPDLAFPLPRTPELLDEPAINLDQAVKAFIKYVSDYDDDHILIGWNNRSSLPQDNNYCVFWQISTKINGSTVMSYDAANKKKREDGNYYKQSYYETEFQIDCYGDISSEHTARKQAAIIANAGRCYLGTRFFDDYDIACLDCYDPRQINFTDTSKQYVERWSVTLRLAYWSGVKAQVSWFDEANIKLFNFEKE